MGNGMQGKVGGGDADGGRAVLYPLTSFVIHEISMALFGCNFGIQLRIPEVGCLHVRMRSSGWGGGSFVQLSRENKEINVGTLNWA